MSNGFTGLTVSNIVVIITTRINMVTTGRHEFNPLCPKTYFLPHRAISLAQREPYKRARQNLPTASFPPLRPAKSWGGPERVFYHWTISWKWNQSEFDIAKHLIAMKHWLNQFFQGRLIHWTEKLRLEAVMLNNITDYVICMPTLCQLFSNGNQKKRIVKQIIRFENSTKLCEASFNYSWR